MMERWRSKGRGNIAREEGMATRLVGPVCWKVQCAITLSGAVVSWTILARKPKRVHLGYAMGVVKDDHVRLDWDWNGMMTGGPYRGTRD